jgi:hypothetical protein
MSRGAALADRRLHEGKALSSSPLASNLGRRFLVPRGFPVRPVPEGAAETGSSARRLAAVGAVQHEILETALEAGFHLEEFEPQHLRVDGDRYEPSRPASRPVDDRGRATHPV